MLNHIDVDDSAGDLTYTVSTVPGNGTLHRLGVALNAGDQFSQAEIDAGSITYTHDGSETTSDNFVFELSDGLEDGVQPITGTFQIQINPVNDHFISPIQDSDLAVNQVDENVANGTTVGITAFADDLDLPDTVTYSLEDDAGGRFQIDQISGVVTVRDGSLLDFDTIPQHDITVRATSTDGSTLTRVFRIDLNDINETPSIVLNNGSTVDEGQSDVIEATELLVDDPEDAPFQLTYTVTGGLANGQLELTSNPGVAITRFTQFDIDNRLVQYVHNGSETTADLITFDLDDGAGNTLTGNTFDIIVNPINDDPIANNDNHTINEDMTLSAGSVLTNDSDVDSPILTARIASLPSHAEQFILNTDGTFTYIPDENYHGQDSFEYEVVDDAGNTSAATVSIDILPINDLPSAQPDMFNVLSGDVLNELVGVMANDSDVDGDALVAILVDQPTNGSLVFNSDGTFSYTPTGNFIGTDTFSYVLNDGTADGSLTTVSIEVEPFGFSGGGGTPGDPQDPGDPADPMDPMDQIEDKSTDPMNSGEDNSPLDDIVIGQVVLENTADTIAGTADDTESLTLDDLLTEVINNQELPDQRAAVEILEWLSEERAIKSSKGLSDLDNSFANGLTFVYDAEELWGELDRLADDVANDIAFNVDARTPVAITSLTLTAGYIIWSLRGGFLMATLVQSLPTWTHIDPLPIVESPGDLRRTRAVDATDRLFE